jgi:hypothetical protein
MDEKKEVIVYIKPEYNSKNTISDYYQYHEHMDKYCGLIVKMNKLLPFDIGSLTYQWKFSLLPKCEARINRTCWYYLDSWVEILDTKKKYFQYKKIAKRIILKVEDYYHQRMKNVN